MDAIQSRIEFLKETFKLLKAIVEFVAEYFPSDADFGGNFFGIDSSWEFYNQVIQK